MSSFESTLPRPLLAAYDSIMNDYCRDDTQRVKLWYQTGLQGQRLQRGHALQFPKMENVLSRMQSSEGKVDFFESSLCDFHEHGVYATCYVVTMEYDLMWDEEVFCC